MGVFRLPRTSQPVPSKSKIAEPSNSLISTRRDTCAENQLVQVGKGNDEGADW